MKFSKMKINAKNMTLINLSLIMSLSFLIKTLIIKMVIIVLQQIKILILIIQTITKSGKSGSLDMNGIGLVLIN